MFDSLSEVLSSESLKGDTRLSSDLDSVAGLRRVTGMEAGGLMGVFAGVHGVFNLVLGGLASLFLKTSNSLVPVGCRYKRRITKNVALAPTINYSHSYLLRTHK